MPSEIVFLTAQIVGSIASETKLSPQEMLALIRNVYTILDGLKRKVDKADPKSN